MADKKTTSPEKTTVHRIKASGGGKIAKKGSPKKKSDPVKKTKKVIAEEKPTRNPFVKLGRYVKGAWSELKQVRWPNRAATWSMTLAVLIFTAIFVVLILLLDAGFNAIFELLLG